MRARTTVAALIACTAACNFHLGSPAVDASFTIGPRGGDVGLASGPMLHIPAGALASDQVLTVAISAAPSDGISALATFGPAGLTFAHPATVTFPVPDGTGAVELRWGGADAWGSLPAALDRGVVSAQVSRLGAGYVRAGPPGRTVTGRLATVYEPSGATGGGALGRIMHVTALWVPGGTGSWVRLPVVENADFSFAVPHVPEGPYLIEVDTLYGNADFSADLFQFVTSTPDLSMVSYARPDVRMAAQSPIVTLDVANLMPWVQPSGAFSGDLLLMAGAQANVFGRPRGVRPAAGATTWQGSFDWNLMTTNVGAIGLPEASKGDVEFLYQRATRPVGSGVAHAAARFQRLDSLTLADGQGAAISATLQDAPQTGALHVDLPGTQWAALARQVSPNAQFSTVAAGGTSVLAIPGSIDFPLMPEPGAGTSLLWVQPPDGMDVNYGDVSYGQFLGAGWKEVRYALYDFAVQSLAPAGGAPVSWDGEVWTIEPMPVQTQILPRVGPPRAPLIQGRDAFVGQAGVGLTPAISWSPPAIGSATSYQVRITRVPVAAGFQFATLTVHGATSVTVPPGILMPDAQYIANIAAVWAPWDVADVPAFRTGAPQSYAECVTAVFTP